MEGRQPRLVVLTAFLRVHGASVRRTSEPDAPLPPAPHESEAAGNGIDHQRAASTCVGGDRSGTFESTPVRRSPRRQHHRAPISASCPNLESVDGSGRPKSANPSPNGLLSIVIQHNVKAVPARPSWRPVRFNDEPLPPGSEPNKAAGEGRNPRLVLLGSARLRPERRPAVGQITSCSDPPSSPHQSPESDQRSKRPVDQVSAQRDGSESKLNRPPLLAAARDCLSVGRSSSRQSVAHLEWLNPANDAPPKTPIIVFRRTSQWRRANTRPHVGKGAPLRIHATELNKAAVKRRSPTACSAILFGMGESTLSFARRFLPITVSPFSGKWTAQSFV